MGYAAKLPDPIDAHWDWQVQAACRGLDASIFFHPENERGHSKRRREAGAKAICATCSVLRPCLLWALAVPEPYGIWGGTTAAEREELNAVRARTARRAADS